MTNSLTLNDFEKIWLVAEGILFQLITFQLSLCCSRKFNVFYTFAPRLSIVSLCFFAFLAAFEIFKKLDCFFAVANDRLVV